MKRYILALLLIVCLIGCDGDSSLTRNDEPATINLTVTNQEKFDNLVNDLGE